MQTRVHLSVPEGFQPFPKDQGFTDHIGPLYWRIDDGVGVMGFVVSDIHMNPAGICHGGVMMTLMDMAVGMNVQLAAENEIFSPTIQMSFDFLKPAYKDEWLFSEINFRHVKRYMYGANYSRQSKSPNYTSLYISPSDAFPENTWYKVA